VRGRIKRVALSEFASVRPSGLIAMGLDKGDELGWARLTTGKDDILLITAGGHALRMVEKEVRSMGRQASGVTGIALKKDDRLTSMEVVEPGGSLLVVTEFGHGKQTRLEDYSPKGRASQGVSTIDQHSLDKIGKIAAARVVQPTDEVTLISSGGQMLRIKVSQISSSGRATRGVRLMGIQAGDAIASVARIPAEVEV
jgi:DNA gyrase subunit A